VISVKDRGRGIPADLQEKIFERFERAEADHSDVPGLGLGLYITKQIVTTHGGRISVESTPGQGSVFKVEI
jgi:signal transduction histidine kinase